ncbi:hypothetical protein JXB11_02440 [Candidatus Woesearchaeota archaeon]|nr:hypothetical protein [Candidatus Woesearchaeota archaeon]
MEPMPTEGEIQRWMLDTLKHSFRVEYFMKRLFVGNNHAERPHDIAGKGNKYEWDVIKGLALQYRNDESLTPYINASMEIHRQQRHHRLCNEPDPNDDLMTQPEANEDDMFESTVDSICSLLEDRTYQGGAHSYDEIKVEDFPPHKQPYVKIFLPRMRSLKQPDLEAITSLESFPNAGMAKEFYQTAVRNTNEALSRLRAEGVIS